MNTDTPPGNDHAQENKRLIRLHKPTVEKFALRFGATVEIKGKDSEMAILVTAKNPIDAVKINDDLIRHGKIPGARYSMPTIKTIVLAISRKHIQRSLEQYKQDFAEEENEGSKSLKKKLSTDKALVEVKNFLFDCGKKFSVHYRNIFPNPPDDEGNEYVTIIASTDGDKFEIEKMFKKHRFNNRLKDGAGSNFLKVLTNGPEIESFVNPIVNPEKEKSKNTRLFMNHLSNKIKHKPGRRRSAASVLAQAKKDEAIRDSRVRGPDRNPAPPIQEVSNSEKVHTNEDELQNQIVKPEKQNNMNLSKLETLRKSLWKVASKLGLTCRSVTYSESKGLLSVNLTTPEEAQKMAEFLGRDGQEKFIIALPGLQSIRVSEKIKLSSNGNDTETETPTTTATKKAAKKSKRKAKKAKKKVAVSRRPRRLKHAILVSKLEAISEDAKKMAAALKHTEKEKGGQDLTPEKIWQILSRKFPYQKATLVFMTLDDSKMMKGNPLSKEAFIKLLLKGA